MEQEKTTEVSEDSDYGFNIPNFELDMGFETSSFELNTICEI